MRARAAKITTRLLANAKHGGGLSLMKPTGDGAVARRVQARMIVASESVAAKKMRDATEAKSRGSVKVSKTVTDFGADASRKNRPKLWNKNMPRLSCNSCAMTAQCPQYRAGYECAFLPFLHGHTIESESDLMHYAKELAKENVRRVQVGMMMETMTGQQPSVELSEQSALAFGQLMQLHERVTARMEVQGDGDGSILNNIFGDMRNLMAHTDAASVERADFVIDEQMAEQDKTRTELVDLTEARV